MTKHFRSAALSLIAAGFASAAPAPATPAPPNVLRMRAAHVFDDSHAWHKCFERLSELVKARTSGAVEVQIFSRGVLGQEKDYVQHLLLGRLELAVIAPAWAGNLAKQMSLLDMLFLWRDRQHWVAALDGDVGARLAKIIEQETAKGGHPGLKVLGYLGGSERYIMSRSQGFSAVNDLTGIKFRVLDSPPQIESWRKLGTLPVPLPFNLAYGALKSGSVDSLENEMANAYHMNLHEVAPHVTETAHILTVRPVLMSGHTWAKLSTAQQAIMLEAAHEAIAYGRSVEWRQNDEAVAEMKKAGVKFYAFPKKSRDQMRELTQPIREKLAQDLGLTDILQAIERSGASDGRASR
jgi:TRAP-type C4-dicarboxylate transport system substrate-binding protein